MAPIELTGIITPKEGQSQRFLELFNNCVEYVRENEPGVYRYELHVGLTELNGGKEQFVVLEGYKDKEAMDKHMITPPVVAMLKAMEEKDFANVQVIMTKKGPGVARL